MKSALKSVRYKYHQGTYTPQGGTKKSTPQGGTKKSTPQGGTEKSTPQWGTAKSTGLLTGAIQKSDTLYILLIS
jgi:hypothetical protein